MTGIAVETVSVGAALLAGFAGSGHCLAMCGGIAGALAVRDSARDGAPPRWQLAVAYNVARITSYAGAGAIAGLLGSTLLRGVDVSPWAAGLRVLAGAIMVAAAGRLLFGWRVLEPLERGGAFFWRRLAPVTTRTARRPGIAGAIGLGLGWGWLPCGLSYSMLLLAATTASAAGGALVMAAFGLGTLPSMVSATIAFEQVTRVLARRATLRNVAGTLLLVFGAWTAGQAINHGLAHGGHGGAEHEHAGTTAENPPARPHLH